MGNSRGNKYSRNHRIWNPDNEDRYWDFSWDEVGKYDLPAVTDFILRKNGHSKLAYIAHSMGNNQAFSAIHDDLDYFKNKWSLFISLAPAVRIVN